MENIVVIVSSAERTRKLLTYASEMAKASGSKIWLVCDLNDEKGEKDNDNNKKDSNISDSIKNRPYPVPFTDSTLRNSLVTPYLNELNSKGIPAEPLFFKKLDKKDFLNKVLVNQILTTNSRFHL